MGINCTSFCSHDRRFYSLQMQARRSPALARIAVWNIKSPFVVLHGLFENLKGMMGDSRNSSRSECDFERCSTFMTIHSLAGCRPYIAGSKRKRTRGGRPECRLGPAHSLEYNLFGVFGQKREGGKGAPFARTTSKVVNNYHSRI